MNSKRNRTRIARRPCDLAHLVGVRETNNKLCFAAMREIEASVSHPDYSAHPIPDQHLKEEDCSDEEKVDTAH